MATSDHRNLETTEQWALLEHGGGTDEDVLLQDQDGDERDGKENDRKTAEVLEGETESLSFSWCFRSAWNDAVVRKALWEDRRPYIFGIALFVNAVLIVLAALTSLTECYNVQVTLTCLRHSALAMLYAAALSCATRFISLSVVKASVVRNFEVKELLDRLSVYEELILVTAFLSCLYHLGAGIMVYQKARREEHFVWYVQLLADVVRVQALTGAMVLPASLIYLMRTDIRAAFRASRELSREWWEARRRGGFRKPWPGMSAGIPGTARGLLKSVIAALCIMVLLQTFIILSPDGALELGVVPAASGGT